jgi:transcription antitermination factor NusG
MQQKLLDDELTAEWYVIKVKNFKDIKKLENFAFNHNYRIFVPIERFLYGDIIETSPLFLHYAFLKLDESLISFVENQLRKEIAGAYFLKNKWGYRKVFGTDIMRNMKETFCDTPPELKCGDEVEIASGPFAGSFGKIISTSPEYVCIIKTLCRNIKISISPKFVKYFVK